MKIHNILSLSLLLIGFQANASIVDLTPDTTGVLTSTVGNASSEWNVINQAFSNDFSANSQVLYKSDDSDLIASDYYSTTFTNTPSDPENALIEWTMGPSIINCVDGCFLAVKGGSGSSKKTGLPSYYLFDISNWDGQEGINLTGFWPEQGAIGHISIWAGAVLTSNDPITAPATVPVPAAAWLFGSAFAGLVGFRKRKAI